MDTANGGKPIRHPRPAVAFPQALKDSDQIETGDGEAVRARAGVETFAR